MKRLMSLLALFLSLALSVAGCKGPDNIKAPGTAADDPLPAGAYPQIVLLGDLPQVLVKQNVEFIRDPGSRLPPIARATLRSVADKTTIVQYRFLFFGPDGESLTRNPVWRERAIQARTRVILEANAINLDATRFEMEVRRSR